MAKVLVYHSSYGCDTGCCGHAISVDGIEQDFYFEHPWSEDPLKWAKAFVKAEMGEEHVADLDWENCQVVDD